MITKIFSFFFFFNCYPADGVTGCSLSLNKNEFNQCVVDRVTFLTPALMKGIPSMRLPGLDPFSLPSLSVDRSLDSLVIKTNLTNIQATGASNYAIKDISVDPHKLTLGMKIHMPQVQVKGNYDVKGRLLLLILNGIGAFKGNFCKCKKKKKIFSLIYREFLYSFKILTTCFT